MLDVKRKTRSGSQLFSFSSNDLRSRRQTLYRPITPYPRSHRYIFHGVSVHLLSHCSGDHPARRPLRVRGMGAFNQEDCARGHTSFDASTLVEIKCHECPFLCMCLPLASGPWEASVFMDGREGVAFTGMHVLGQQRQVPCIVWFLTIACALPCWHPQPVSAQPGHCKHSRDAHRAVHSCVQHNFP